jgi:hypothetical protein
MQHSPRSDGVATTSENGSFPLASFVVTPLFTMILLCPLGTACALKESEPPLYLFDLAAFVRRQANPLGCKMLKMPVTHRK